MGEKKEFQKKAGSNPFLGAGGSLQSDIAVQVFMLPINQTSTSFRMALLTYLQQITIIRKSKCFIADTAICLIHIPRQVSDYNICTLLFKPRLLLGTTTTTP